MKTVNKYIIASCVFCYLGGLYLILAKAGIMRLISRYGINQLIREWPEEFPSLTVVYIGLAIYTLLYIVIGFCIYRTIEKHSKETDKLQQKSSVIHNYSEQLSAIISKYDRICREKSIVNKSLMKRFQLLQRQVAALSPSIFKEIYTNDCITQLINELQDVITNLQVSTAEEQAVYVTQLNNIIENGIIDIQQIQNKSITIK